jgi:hypothetical protein
MRTLHNTAPFFSIFLIVFAAIGFYPPQVQAEERSRWDVKSFPRLPSVEKLNEEIEGYQLPHVPEEGKALVYVVRPGVFLGLVRFGVYVDDKDRASKVGHNRTRQYIHFNLEPGEHTIYSRASNWSEISVNVEAGETIVIEQEQNAFVRNFLVLLSEDGGKYRIKKAGQGTILRTNG